tara:strand:+ start:194 stop:493 length:300 start_codon:yes stop_codon:yes gene_type:complete
MRTLQVENMRSSSGKSVPNQFIIKMKTEGPYFSETFQSYSSTIARRIFSHHGTKIVLDKNYWDYSVTTGKYRNQFLGEGIAETRKKIKEGQYKLVDLNN